MVFHEYMQFLTNPTREEQTIKGGEDHNSVAANDFKGGSKNASMAKSHLHCLVQRLQIKVRMSFERSDKPSKPDWLFNILSIL